MRKLGVGVSRRGGRACAGAVFFLALAGVAQGAERANGDLPSVIAAAVAEAIPPRPGSAPTGSQFIGRIAGLAGRARERAVVEQLLDGNLPVFLRELKPVHLVHRGRRGKIAATIYVMPDYLAIGDDDDYVRMPMDLYSAVAVGRAFGFVLPTSKMVDAIYEQSALCLQPEPMKAGPQMRTTAYFLTHNQRIKRQRGGRAPGTLISGHKKDLVLSNRLAARPGREAIYGWHRSKQRPIQPLSTIHGASYKDYSHGVRLVSETVLINGVPKSVYEVLRDPQLAPVLSDEGAIPEIESIMNRERS